MTDNFTGEFPEIFWWGNLDTWMVRGKTGMVAQSSGYNQGW